MRLVSQERALLELAFCARWEGCASLRRDVGMQANVREHGRPELPDVRIDDGNLYDASTRQLEDIFVLNRT